MSLKTRKLLVFNHSNGMGEVLGRENGERESDSSGWGAICLARTNMMHVFQESEAVVLIGKEHTHALSF